MKRFAATIASRPLPGAASLLWLCMAAVACGGKPAGTTTSLCEPECPPGQTCTEEGCVLTAPPPDLAAGGPGELASPCGACVGATPKCNAAGLCVACIEDGDCPQGQQCVVVGAVTACAPGCKDDARCGGGSKLCCNGQCLDVSADALHCGACGKPCGGLNATGKCEAGQCVAGSCLPGWGECNQNVEDGCEARLDYDVNNCNGCGKKCVIPNAIPGCGRSTQDNPGGCYLKACHFGSANCNGNDEDGCEVSVLADVRNCGDCGTSCPGVPNARVGCLNAVCALTGCNVGFMDCDRNQKNGCEVVTASDRNNCGGCGLSCGQGQVCVNGACTCQQCNIANAKTKCVNNMCVFDECVAGFVDCNFDIRDGCEVDTTKDIKNCGACGNVCPMNKPSCQNSVCSVQTCLNNPKWQAVNCSTGEWVWSRDKAKAKDVNTANQLRLLTTAQVDNGRQALCSLDSKGWISTATFVMAGCNQSWYHIGGRYTGDCGGHDGELWRHLVLGDNDCYDY